MLEIKQSFVFGSSDACNRWKGEEKGRTVALNGEEGGRFRRFKLGLSSSWGGPRKKNGRRERFLQTRSPPTNSAKSVWVGNRVGSALMSVQLVVVLGAREDQRNHPREAVGCF